jgi:subtilisin family serine protease
MAGPHVAGMVALIISANPALAGNVEAIENILEASAVPTVSDKDCGDFVGAVVPNAVFGYGIANVYTAVKMAQDFTSGLTESTEHLVRVFPNPSNDVVTFVLENGLQSIDEINVYTIGGSILRSNKYQQQMMASIQIHDLPIGIYIYKVKSGDQVSMGKFIKI